MLLIIILIISVFFLIANTKNEPPAVSISLRVIEVYEDSAMLRWHVKNSSEQKISFDKNNIMLLYVNNKQRSYDIPKTELLPNEEFKKEFFVKDLNLNYSNTIKATAKSNNGTTASMIIKVKN